MMYQETFLVADLIFLAEVFDFDNVVTHRIKLAASMGAEQGAKSFWKFGLEFSELSNVQGSQPRLQEDDTTLEPIWPEEPRSYSGEAGVSAGHFGGFIHSDAILPSRPASIRKRPNDRLSRFSGFAP
jgi:hypothetical protein